MKYIICVIIFIFLMLIPTGCSRQSIESELTPYQGIWEGNVELGSNASYDIIIDVYVDNKTQNVLISSKKYKFRYLSVEWEIDNNNLIFTMNDEANRANVRLSLSDKDALLGTYTQYFATNEISLKKVSDKAKNGKYSVDYETYTYEERIQQLKDYSAYKEDDITIPFTYELGVREEYEEFISEYELDTVTEGLNDIDLMIALLNWVSDKFKHDGNSGLPEERNAITLTEFYKNEGGINCRGLSIILSELLRVYHVPAKHITCMPKEAVFEDCHVVVHAYSVKLDQWVMLDPTYRLILQNKEGDYVNLPMLRDALLHDEELIANKNAGWNGNKFRIDDYSEYMTKNTFRFQCATEFNFGAEDGRASNTTNMLIPYGYEEDKEERTTTYDKVFWAKP